MHRSTPQFGLGHNRRVHRLRRSGLAEALARSRIGEKPGRLVIFAAGAHRWLTAPIRNETPRFPRLTGTKTPVFGAYPEWITKNPYLK